MSTFHNPFLKRRPNPKRRTPRRVGNGRVKLYVEDKTDLRRQAFERSGGRCESVKGEPIINVMTQEGLMALALRCNRRITWESMELSHEEHGPNKSDTLATVKASCKECHREKHNPKPCPRRPGRIMDINKAERYWLGEKCGCGNKKKARESLCPECNLKISEVTRHGLEQSQGQAYCEFLQAAELEVLRWRAQ